MIEEGKMNVSPAVISWLKRIPKVELHLHLEGAIPYETLWNLVQKYQGNVASLEELKQRFVYRDFPHFIETWIWKNQFLREYEDFQLIAESVARDLLQQNIYYAEIFFSPSDFAKYGLDLQKLIDAVHQGLQRVPEIKIHLVIDLVRDYGPKQAQQTLQKIQEMKQYSILGVGIGGSEQMFPPEPFAEVYENARNMGFFTSAHAGEAAGSESVWGAVRSLKVDRIGHGTRVFEDPKLLQYLVETQIPIEMCPISNVRTGVVASFEAHPIRQYMERGLFITVNTDDPKMFGNSMLDEFTLLLEKQQCSLVDIQQFILNGIQASWLSSSAKKELATRFQKDPRWALPLNR